MIGRNFRQSLKKFCTWGSEPPHIFENLKFELQDPKAVIKGAFRSHIVAMVTYCVKKNDDNVFTNDWAVF